MKRYTLNCNKYQGSSRLLKSLKYELSQWQFTHLSMGSCLLFPSKIFLHISNIHDNAFLDRFQDLEQGLYVFKA
jgi:hypothetical protein